MPRLVDRLRSRAAERFVGRETELALIRESLAVDPPAASVFVVHGPGGVGKTSLLERVRVRALAAALGIDSLRLDARDIEPAPDGLLRALGAALGLAAGDATLARVVDAWSRRPRRVLLIDTFECIAHLDGWLRQSLLPELPDLTRVVIAGRTTPDPAVALAFMKVAHLVAPPASIFAPGIASRVWRGARHGAGAAGRLERAST